MPKDPDWSIPDMINEESLLRFRERCAEAQAGKRRQIQEPALIEAFRRIKDDVVREQILLLVEIISENPMNIPLVNTMRLN